jgi:rhodanese-related sulfurtransferase
MLKKLAVIAVAGLMSVHSVTAIAADATSVPDKKRTTLGLYLTSTEAYQVATSEKVLFVDVRTRAEVNFLGMPTVADANIPYMELDQFYAWDEKKSSYKLDVNSAFMTELSNRLEQKGMGKDGKIIVMCRSGDRSAAAANFLAKAGFKNVYSVVDGFEGDLANDGPNKGQRVVNGWRNNKLPWSYTLAKTKMYIE